MGDVEENVNIEVHGADEMAEAAAEARLLADELHKVDEAAAEAGASAADLEPLNAQLDRARDKAAETAVAMDAMKHSAGGGAFKGIADDLGLTTADLERKLPQIAAIGEEAQARLKAAQGDIEKMGTPSGDAAAKLAADMERLQGSIRSEGLKGSEAGIAGGGAVEKYAADLEKLKADLAAAEPQVDAMNAAIGRSADDSAVAAHALGNWHGAVSDIGGGGDIGTAIRSSEELDGALADMRVSGDDAARMLEDLTGGPGGGGPLEDLAGGAGDAGKSAEGLGGSLGSLGSLGMPALITGIASAASTIGPVLLSAAAGAGAFGAMAMPALHQVAIGFEAAYRARQSYQQAAEVARLDPTTMNVARAKTALAALQATYANMPSAIRKAVVGIEQLGNAWSEAGKKSGIQQDALKDIPKVADDIKGLIPATTKLAQATAPVISGILTDIRQAEQSKGFKTFIGNITSQIPQAAKQLHGLGDALGGVVTQLTTKSNMKVGDNLLGSVSGLLKSVTPGAVRELAQVAKGITAVNNAVVAGQKKGGILNQAGDAWDKTMGAVSKADSWSSHVLGNIFGGHLGKDLSGITGVKTNLAGQDYYKQQGEAAGKAFAAGYAGAVKAAQDAKSSGQGAVLKGSQKDIAPPRINASVKDAQAAKAAMQKAGEDAGKAYSDGIKSGAASASSGAKSAADAAAKALTSGGQDAAKAGQQTGKQYASAVGQGVQSGAGKVTSSVRAMGAQMKGALSGLTTAFNAVGVAADAGLAAGISAGEGAAVAAAHSLASQVEAAARVELQTHSPSLKFKKIGTDTILGYILGLQGGKAAVQAAMKDVLGSPFRDATIAATITKLRTEITTLAQSWNPRTANEGTQLTRLLDTDNGKLQKLAKQRQTLISQIKAADALAASVQAAAIAGGDLTSIAPNTIAGQQQANLASGAPGTAQNPYQNIQQGLQAQLTAIRQFRGEIKQLKKDGLDKAGIQQLLAAGVQSGGATAQQMLAEGKAGVQQIAKLQDSIGLASKKLGVTGANAAYESGADIGGALAAGLKSALKSVDNAMESIARTLVTSLMTALGASAKDIKAALAKLDKELGISGGGSSSGGGSGAGKMSPPHKIYDPPVHLPGPIRNPVTGGAGTMHPAAVQPIIVYVQVDGKTIARSVQSAAMQHANRNPATYPNLPGRAA